MKKKVKITSMTRNFQLCINLQPSHPKHNALVLLFVITWDVKQEQSFIFFF